MKIIPPASSCDKGILCRVATCTGHYRYADTGARA